jgi:ElaB/YqjD/DUF883 family membrane-anchored ribosome-binding protein
MADEKLMYQGSAVSPQAGQFGEQNEVQEAGSRMSDAGSSTTYARQSARQVWDNAKERSRKFQQDTNLYVRQNPIRAVFTALGIGFALGAILRR